MSFAIVACPDPSSKCCDDDNLLDIGATGKVWVNSEVVGVLCPMLPVFLPCFVVVIHHAIVDGFPRRQDITFELNLFRMWYSFQEYVLSGNIEEKTSMKGLLACVNCFSLKERDAASAILLSFPAR